MPIYECKPPIIVLHSTALIVAADKVPFEQKRKKSDVLQFRTTSCVEKTPKSRPADKIKKYKMKPILRKIAIVKLNT